MAARMKKSSTPEVKKVVRQSDNFKDMKEGDILITFNPETDRFVLYNGSDFRASDQNLGSVIYHANRYHGTKFGIAKKEDNRTGIMVD